MTIKVFTGIGARRRQEDSYRVVDMPEQARALLVVADGMGGHGYGDEASKVVVSAIAENWQGSLDLPDSEEKMADIVARAGEAYERNAAGREMGSTLVMASIEGRQVYLAHCGDSRIYVWHRENNQRFHTNDHSIITPEGWEFVRNAFFTDMCYKISPEIRCIEMQPGDRIMLCSDGVSRYVPEGELWRAFTSDQSIEGVADDIEAYCMAVSSDNFTAILVEF